MKFYLETLGCPKNEVESDILRTIINAEETDEYGKADFIIINTCAFIKPAVEESEMMIAEFLEELKPFQKLIVTGCYLNRNSENLIHKFKNKIILCQIRDINKFFKTSLKREKELRFVDEFKNYAYVKIAEGCNKKCGYCTIPSIKGKYVSRDINEIYDEIFFLVTKKNIKEIILVSQDTAYYGRDLKFKNHLIKLLDKITKIEKDFRLRLMYLNPDVINFELIKYIANNPKICNYLDIPIQHTETEMLKLMRRKSTKEDILTLIEDIRNYYPDFVIRTTVIVGYPGETEELFENMLKTLEKLEFDKLGVFKYCDENDVYSYMLPNKVDEEIKDFRYDSIMAQQQKISFKSCSKYVGKTLKVLVDGYDEETDTIISRDEFNSPEIDGSILFQTKKNIDIMDFFYITITGNDDYDLIGELNNV